MSNGVDGYWAQCVRKCVFLQEVFVNLDPAVLEVLEEARWMSKLGVSVPKTVVKMSSREAQLKVLYKR